MDASVTVKNAVVKIHGIFGLLLVVVVGSVISAPNPHPRATNPLERYEPFVDSSASTAEVLRKVHTFMTVAKPLGGKRKLLKQEEAEATMGAANALAYLTDSFGGQIAGQVLALILSSVTGDVRGILGNSLNLFQDDERRDRVQIFLDDISKQFLEFTGLVGLTTTKRPGLQTTLYPGQIVLGSPSTGTGQQQQGNILALQPASASAISVPSSGGVGSSYGTGTYGTATNGVRGSYGSATSSLGGSFAPASSGGVGGLSAANAALLQQVQQQQQQQQQQAQKPVIYVLPQLSNGAATSSVSATASAATSETKAPGNKVTSSSSNIGGDDDSEEEERRERERDRE